ncbi:MAG: hypothetical protein ACT4P1_01405 [Sporichthyaceae bacterium]
MLRQTPRTLVIASVLALTATFGLSACGDDDESSPTEVTNNIEEGAEDTGDAIEEGAEDTGDAVEEGTDDAKDSVQNSDED